MSLESFSRLFGTASSELGIKLKHPEADRALLPELEKIAGGLGGTFSSWRDTSRSFFGALRTEKVMMLLILALVFVVVAVNIDHALRRMATERQEDLALLKSIGASPYQLRLLFLSQGLAIGAAGAVTGSIFGVLVGMNVGSIIRFARKTWFFLRSGSSEFQVGAGDAFFRSSEVMLADVLIIAFLALLLSSVAALRAASMASRLNPAAVLRSE